MKQVNPIHKTSHSIISHVSTYEQGSACKYNFWKYLRHLHAGEEYCKPLWPGEPGHIISHGSSEHCTQLFLGLPLP